MPSFPHRLLAALAVAPLALFSALQAQDFAWIESESIEAPPAPAEAKGWASPELLSGEVLSVEVAAKDSDKMPKGGIILSYDFEAPSAGSYEAWNRVVFEGIRSPFEWRVNGGDWQTNSQAGQPITNVQELAFWNPIGWTKMGDVDLEAGANKVEIRLKPQVETDRDGNKKPADLKYISDAIAFVKGSWQPNFKHKPDWTPDSEQDREAAEKTFTWTDDNEPRQTLSLDGIWQYAPWDEIGEITEEARVSGVDALPDGEKLSWYGLEVPADRNQIRPDFTFNHRGIYRTRVDVPESFKGHSFLMNFEALNMIASLFINGKKVDDFDIVYGQWQPDVTEFIKPGETNEIALVLKDQFYALGPESNGNNVRNTQYVPMSLFHRNQGTTMRFDFPVKGAILTGIVDEVSLTATGPAYVEDVFVKPYPITRNELEIDVTLDASGNSPQEVTVKNRIEPWSDATKGTATLPDQTARVTPGEPTTLTVKAPTEGLELWWLYEPKLYNLVTEVYEGDKLVDRKTTRFGVREWEQRGNQFYLNGVRQHLRADLTHYGAGEDQNLDQVVADWKENGMNVFRLRFQWPWAGKTPRETLEWTDEVGIPVRKNAGTFDGQHASYQLALKEGKGKDMVKSPNAPLFENWRKQMVNRAKARRNHPSVWIWELDNEIVYINGRNFGNLDVVEPEFTKTSNAIMEMDPTRKTMTGGGNALMDESLPTYGPHYFEVNDREYPDEAYTLERSLARQGTGEGGKVWPLDYEKMPTFLSETAFLPGRDPASFSQVGGEVAFLSKQDAKPAIGKIASWLAAGYRWAEMGGTHFWFSKDFTDGSYTHAWQPIAALVRQWNWSFGPGQKVTRDFKVFNDTLDDSPITVNWSYLVDGKSVAEGSKTFEIAPGGNEEWSTEFETPKGIDTRTPATYVVTATQNGEKVYEHEETSAILPEPEGAAPKVDGKFVVWDPKGEATEALKARGANFTSVSSMEEIPDDFELLIVGRDAISPDQATDRKWLQWTSAGKKILVLEQENPLHYQALAADLEPSDYDGRIAFSQNLDHPVFAGLTQEDLALWSGDHVVYKNAYAKATRGARSLAHADEKLNYTALSFSPVEDGAILLNQFVVGEKLKTDVTARTLFNNMVDYVAGYQPVKKQSILVADQDSPAAKTIAEIGLSYTTSDNPVAAIENKEAEIVIVEATKERMDALAGATDKVNAFNDRGGWLVILGITPDTLDDFNKIVGVDHIIRPFVMERVQFPAVRDPLTAGLSLRDVVMTSGERIQVHSRDEWPADDAFEYIVDLDDIAPFSEFPGPEYWNDPDTKGPGTDTWPRNMVNGFLADIHWRVIFSIHLQKGDPTAWTVKFPREEEVTGITIAPNTIYHRITALKLTFNGDASTAKEFELDQDSEQIEVQFDPVKATEMEIELTDWDESGRNDVIGVDNLWIKVKRPDDWAERVKPMLNIGGLVKYPRGNGGILLSQYALRDNESNPLNLQKKRTVLATLLRNLGGIFSKGGTVVPGSNLEYTTISLEDYCNLYLTSNAGWPNKKVDLGAFPLGRQTFDGVPFDIRDFETSPLENAVTLANNRPKTPVDEKAVKGMKVGRKAEALFFLHTFLQGRNWKPSNREPEPPALFQYTVHYDDDTTEVVPVVLNSGVTDWLLEAEPRSLRDAAVAWTAKVEDPKTENAVVYQMQWTNPNPEKTITSVDLTYAEKGQQFGAPVLLGLTSAQKPKSAE